MRTAQPSIDGCQCIVLKSASANFNFLFSLPTTFDPGLHTYIEQREKKSYFTMHVHSRIECSIFQPFAMRRVTRIMEPDLVNNTFYVILQRQLLTFTCK